jgi:hypothetical protein
MGLTVQQHNPAQVPGAIAGLGQTQTWFGGSTMDRDRLGQASSALMSQGCEIFAWPGTLMVLPCRPAYGPSWGIAPLMAQVLVPAAELCCRLSANHLVVASRESSTPRVMNVRVTSLAGELHVRTLGNVPDPVRTWRGRRMLVLRVHVRRLALRNDFAIQWAGRKSPVKAGLARSLADLFDRSRWGVKMG